MNKMQTIHPWLVWRRKILMTMKLGVCFLLCTVFQVSARVTAQNERMNFKMHDASLKTILWALEKKSEMVFFYSVKDIEQVTGIDVVAENKTLDEILSEVLKNTGITYEVTHNTVVLRKGKVNAALPQSKTSEVTGKVTDRSGSPLPGVTILIKGTSLGTVTDTEGIFKIALPQKKDVVLVFSFIGMKTQEIVLKDDKPLKVVMQEDAKEIDEVVEEAKNDREGVFKRYKKYLSEKKIVFTTFHQNYSYEEFIQGIRANTNNTDQLSFIKQDGVFKDLVERAKNDRENYYVMIVDEINRGNVSKIFGELITLLESDKRDKGHHPLKVLLPYSKTLFGVPSNLYIIGTMNTTDRSTGTLDYALRRRFAFVTLQSNPDVIEKHYDKLNNQELKIKAIGLFNDIKSFIMNPKHQCGDFGVDDLMVGHSYFMAFSEDELANKVEFEILPLIAEYISDGIINVSNEEKTKAFQAWSNLQPMQVVEEAVDAEDENLI